MNLYESVKKQILNVYDFLKKDKLSGNLLKVIYTQIELYQGKWINGDVKVFKGYRSQHKNYKQPYKGGIRAHQNVTVDKIKALSTWMSIKTGIVDLLLGSGKGGIIVNLKELITHRIRKTF